MSDCRVYWGSHGCRLSRGHDGPHLCSCAREDWEDHLPDGYSDEEGVWNVGAPPYYGPETRFYGEDAPVHEGPNIPCVDCGEDTMPDDGGAEQYMVTDEIWEGSGMGRHDGCLCVGCLERRLGRELRAVDFATVAMNWVLGPLDSERLRERRQRA